MSRTRKRFLIYAASTAFASLACLLVYTCALADIGTFSAKASVQQQQRVLRIAPSPLMKMVNDRLAQQPQMSDEDLAAYANSLLEQYGYEYYFDVCEFLRTIPRRNSARGQRPYQFQMTQADGRRLTLQAGEDVMTDGMCGECFMAFPSLSVTRAEILLLLKGKQYRLKRPRLFKLDEMSLVDASMKRVIRTWEVPQQSVPLGISADGTRLYMNTEAERLALEISQTGISFKALSRVEIQNGVDVDKHPMDKKNAYLAFMKFTSGRKSYIVRYSAPCT